ncbi:siderophore-interacting protein [Leptospira congkakensis]|uniref:Siderophore-interacting protein n=1 Tax=Leptospira congkakensis TaxID=2484932 RepID=A0A4Z1A556_9LEPT|nr:SIP domain-containing protein [Leptospira congkakensis]TGL88809.1 siderophore-interacting protein [Leptospira congkakensis]TGL89395.1 siderophore-interacting protein [Leptospira congkakensis]TGL97363.1 siderophore-interacting protein [Leptospira congkakensis]
MSETNSFFKRTLKSIFSIFITETKISKIERLTNAFVLIEMKGKKLKESNWVPGGKVQVDVGIFTYRTFTPINVDKAEGKLSFLCFKHHNGPASHWINALKVGDPCEVFGPRESLDFSSLEGDAILFGDETSFGIAKVLQNKLEKKSHLFFELTSTETSKEALEKLGVTGERMIERSADGSHLQKLSQEIVDRISQIPDAKIFLTGRASSIQQVRNYLKNSGIPTNKLKVRAYWADGKKGLD